MSCQPHRVTSGQKKEKKKRGDRKGESIDSPEIPDRRETLDIPGLPSGSTTTKNRIHLYKLQLLITEKKTETVSAYLVNNNKGKMKMWLVNNPLGQCIGRG